MSGPVTLHWPPVRANGIPLVIASEGRTVTMTFRTPAEADKYARDLAETLRDFAHLWRPRRLPGDRLTP